MIAQNRGPNPARRRRFAQALRGTGGRLSASLVSPQRHPAGETARAPWAEVPGESLPKRGTEVSKREAVPSSSHPHLQLRAHLSPTLPKYSPHCLRLIRVHPAFNPLPPPFIYAQHMHWTGKFLKEGGKGKEREVGKIVFAPLLRNFPVAAWRFHPRLG